jgi:elongation factor G
MGDLNTRRAKVQGMETVGTKSVVLATVPLAEVTRYGNDLRSMTGGRGLYTLTFVGYEPVPPQVAQTVIAAHKGG